MIEQQTSEIAEENIDTRYQLLKQLGKQAGRETFLAKDIQTQQFVVIKRLTFGANFVWEDLKLFQREAETLKTLNHPLIPHYIDFFEIDTPSRKEFVLVQNYIKGKSLQEYLDAGRRFSEQEIKQIVTALLDILDYLHKRQPPVIHRDIKPSNILLVNSSDNKIGTVYLVDFGSVQTLASRQGKTVTVVGTYGYMPPEQFGGVAFGASDLYGVGATAIALATGKHPTDLPQTNLKINFEREAEVSPWFAQWLRRMTAPDLEYRFTSVGEAKQALEIPWLTTRQKAFVQKKTITTLGLFWGFLFRSTIAGWLAGHILYSTVYSLVSLWIFNKVSTLDGMPIGIFIGFINGVAIATVTRLFFFPLTNPKRHQRVMTYVGLFLGMVEGILIGKFWLFNVCECRQSLLLRLLAILGTIMFALAVGWGNEQIAFWYAKRSREGVS